MAVVPDFVGQAAGQLENIGSALNAAHAAAAGPTTSVVAAAGDEVSAAIAALFSSHARQYQALNAQAAAFHSQFTNLLNAGAASYLGTEIANAQAAAAPPGFQAIGAEILSVLEGSSAQQIELPLDLVGPLVVATGPLAQGGTAFVSAVQAGNPAAAMAALANAGPSVGSALLYGQDTVSIPLPGSVPGVQTVALNIPFGRCPGTSPARHGDRDGYREPADHRADGVRGWRLRHQPSGQWARSAAGPAPFRCRVRVSVRPGLPVLPRGRTREAVNAHGHPASPGRDAARTSAAE